MSYTPAQWQEAIVSLANTNPTDTLPSIVQKGGAVTGSGAKTVAFTFTNKVTAGNSLVVLVGLGEVVDDSTIICTITDSQSPANTYTRAVQASQSTTLYAAIYYATNVAGDPVTPATVTVTLTGASAANEGLGIYVYEVNGIIELTPAAVDQTGTGNNTGTSVTTTAIVPVAPNEYAFTAIAAGNGVITAGTGWTLDSGSLAPTGGNLIKFGAESRYISALGSITPAATLGSSVAWAAVCATFKPALQNVQGTFTLASGAAVTANAGTNLNTSLLALEAGGNLATLVTNTADLLADGDFLTTIATNTGNIPAKGAAATSASTPVTIASDQTVPIKRSAVAAYSLASTTTSGSTQNSGDITVGPYTEIALDINTTAQAGTSPTIQYFYERKGADGIYYVLWQSNVLTAATNTVSTSIGAGMAYNQSLGSTGRLRWVIGGSSTPTFTHSANITGK